MPLDKKLVYNANCPLSTTGLNCSSPTTSPPTSPNPCSYLSLQSFKSEIMSLEDRIFDAYIELKSGPLISRIKNGMFAGDFSWSRCLQPTDARDYVKIVILELVIIHAQVCFFGIFNAFSQFTSFMKNFSFWEGE